MNVDLPAKLTDLANVDLPDLLVRDAYLASSLMQKAIRRSELTQARNAATALYRHRGGGIWKRLVLIAFEDVGIASPELLALTVQQATSQSGLLAPGDQLQVILEVVEKLSSVGKDRSADYLACTAFSSPDLELVREVCGKGSMEERVSMLSDPTLPLEHRAVAAWYLSGLNVEGETRFGQVDRKALYRCFTDIGVPAGLVDATRAAASITRDPMVLMIPLLWTELEKDSIAPSFAECPVPDATDIRGVPSYTFDKHTRAGKRAGGLLGLENSEVAELLNRFVPDYRIKDAARMAAFYADAVPIRNRFMWSQSQALETLGRQTDMRKVGVAPAGVDPIISCVEQQLPHLNAIRAQIVGQGSSAGQQEGAA